MWSLNPRQVLLDAIQRHVRAALDRVLEPQRIVCLHGGMVRAVIGSVADHPRRRHIQVMAAENRDAEAITS